MARPIRKPKTFSVTSIRSRPAKPGHDLLRNDPDRTVVGQHHVLYPDALTGRYLPGRFPQLRSSPWLVD